MRFLLSLGMTVVVVKKNSNNPAEICRYTLFLNPKPETLNPQLETTHLQKHQNLFHRPRQRYGGSVIARFFRKSNHVECLCARIG